MARPTKYHKDMAEQARKLCLLGATDAELADFFGVNEDTINRWKKAHKEFYVSIKKGKDVADSEVADRLYQRALGFEHDSEDIKVVDGVVERVPIRKIYAPDTGAAIFWLKNRQRNKWRDKQDVDLTSKDKPIPLLAGFAPAKFGVEEDDDGGNTQEDDSSPQDK